MQTVSFWFWTAAIGMGLGSALFAWMGASGSAEHKGSYISSFFITLIAGTMYLTLALGQGAVTVDEGRVVFYARYLTWTLTTPLLLLGLAAVAFAGDLRRNVPLLAGLIGADVYMILTGLIGELSNFPIKYIWFSISSIAFLVILWLIWGPLQAEARQHPRWNALWQRLAIGLTVLWIGYPIVWLLGPAGSALLDPAGQNFGFVSLDLLAKVGWGWLLLSGLEDISRADTRSGGEGLPVRKESAAERL
ncbi:MAG: bacteriorhodopsin [Gemmatimonadaceae bacterium]|nr:bacteriorhodopsin [Gloeobacterales cyanobacterium ES-bin-141]